MTAKTDMARQLERAQRLRKEKAARDREAYVTLTEHATLLTAENERLHEQIRGYLETIERLSRLCDQLNRDALHLQTLRHDLTTARHAARHLLTHADPPAAAAAAARWPWLDQPTDQPPPTTPAPE